MVTVETARSGRSTCKRCKQLIENQTLRIGREMDLGDYSTTHWHHLECWRDMKGTMGDASDLHNFHNLDADRQQEVRAVMELTGAPEAENDDLAAKYSARTMEMLKDVLRTNNQMVGGNKAELVARCVDGEQHGALPPCPTCAAKLLPLGRNPPVLKNAYNGYFCIGHYDEGKCRHVQCATTNFPSHTVQRLGWEDPGHAVLAPTAKKPKAAARTTAKKKAPAKGKKKAKQWSSSDEEEKEARSLSPSGSDQEAEREKESLRAWEEEAKPKKAKKAKKAKAKAVKSEEEEEEVKPAAKGNKRKSAASAASKPKKEKQPKKEKAAKTVMKSEDEEEEDEEAVAKVSASATLQRSTRVRKQAQRWSPE